MTKEHYFEMCEALNSEPVESEIPKELSDFPTEVLLAYNIYSRLQPNFGGMGGYLGKSYDNLFNLFDLYDIDKRDRLMIFDFINIIDSEETSLVNKDMEAKSKQGK